MSIDNRILAEFSKALEVRSGSDLEEGMYVYIAGRWVLVDFIKDDGAVDAAVADHGPRGCFKDVSFRINPKDMYVVVRSDAPVKFDDGYPVGVRWPVDDIICVDEAYLGALDGSEDDPVRVSGLFVRRYDPEEAADCYVPYRPSEQAIPSDISLVEDLDVIVAWRPVSAADILKAVAR